MQTAHRSFVLAAAHDDAQLLLRLALEIAAQHPHECGPLLTELPACLEAFVTHDSVQNAVVQRQLPLQQALALYLQTNLSLASLQSSTSTLRVCSRMQLALSTCTPPACSIRAMSSAASPGVGLHRILRAG